MKSLFSISAENQNSLTIDELQFIHQLSEKKLKETDNSASIVARTTILLTLVATILIALIIYLATHFSSTSGNDRTFLIALFTLIYFFSFGWLLIFNIKGIHYQVIGEDPHIFMRDDFFDAENIDLRKKWFYITEIKRQQEKINFNKGINKICWNRFRFSIYGLAFTPIFLIIAFALVTYLLNH